MAAAAPPRRIVEIGTGEVARAPEPGSVVFVAVPRPATRGVVVGATLWPPAGGSGGGGISLAVSVDDDGGGPTATTIHDVAWPHDVERVPLWIGRGGGVSNLCGGGTESPAVALADVVAVAATEASAGGHGFVVSTADAIRGGSLSVYLVPDTGDAASVVSVPAAAARRAVCGDIHPACVRTAVVAARARWVAAAVVRHPSLAATLRRRRCAGGSSADGRRGRP